VLTEALEKANEEITALRQRIQELELTVTRLEEAAAIGGVNFALLMTMSYYITLNGQFI